MPIYMKLGDIKGDVSDRDMSDGFVFNGPSEPGPFVGGWGSSVYQYAYNDPASDRAAEPDVIVALNFQKIDFEAPPVIEDFLFG